MIQGCSKYFSQKTTLNQVMKLLFDQPWLGGLFARQLILGLLEEVAILKVRNLRPVRVCVVADQY